MKKLQIALSLAALFVCGTAHAATVSFEQVIRQATPEEGDLGLVHSFFVSSDADILRVGDVVIDVDEPLYQDGLGTDTAPPNPAFVAVFPALGADSWITTPGDTAIAGGGFGVDNSAWFDSSNDGPQQDFKFAQITTGGFGTFSGVVSVAGSAGPEIFEFRFVIPEPTTIALFSLGLISCVATRRRS